MAIKNGMQVIDINGDIQIDTNDGIQKYLGTINCDGNQMSGEFSHDDIELQRLWYFIIVDNYPNEPLENDNKQYQHSIPTVTQQNNKILWSFSHKYTPCKILFGVY